MTISVLLPTRDRLDYLKLAIETVRRQESADWELVVSDNDSSEDIGGYLASLNDARIVYQRTSRFVPVTDNWNEALKLSTGDYVVMMGDDDGLLPTYLADMQALVDEFDAPDVIHVGALLFKYPHVDPQFPAGLLTDYTYGSFFEGTSGPLLLTHERAVAAVRKAMHFRLTFGFNMQLSLISRRLIDELRPYGEFFQSPFPDYYATCASLLKAQRIVADPRPHVVIGVTPKSYGFFHLNEREREGRAFLDPDKAAEPELPGTNINDGWLGAMHAVEANFGAEFRVRVSERRYRLVQAAHVYTRSFRGAGSKSETQLFEASLPFGERLMFRGAHSLARLLARLLPQRAWTTLSRRSLGQFPAWSPTPTNRSYKDMLDVFEQFHSPTSTLDGAM
jgi:glycosyltransferase involved in cell wall biosynthesis